MDLSKDSIAAINALKPEARELFDRLISQTKFLNAFYHIANARKNLIEHDQRKKRSWQAKKKRAEHIAALDIPEDYVCVSKYSFASVEYYQAQWYFDTALRNIRDWE